MGKLTSYEARIHGNYLSRYFVDFPIWEILTPPCGWRFLRVTEWRKNCPDACWRIIYVRQALSHGAKQ